MWDYSRENSPGESSMIHADANQTPRTMVMREIVAMPPFHSAVEKVCLYRLHARHIRSGQVVRTTACYSMW